MLSIVFTGTVGIGTLITIATVVGGMVWAYFRIQQGDPSEWRENYLGEVTRREEVERRLVDVTAQAHTFEIELVELRSRTDLQPLMDAVRSIANELRQVANTQHETVEMLVSLNEKIDGKQDAQPSVRSLPKP
jgi:hypothetical protein